jgi:hypothetical protein
VPKQTPCLPSVIVWHRHRCRCTTCTIFTCHIYRQICLVSIATIAGDRWEKGKHVALSHCWGPPAHRPLMTTQASLARHFTSAPWDELPRLYQDAMIATRRLGLEYIWIDSLCIIQDSHNDWLSESHLMGQVYQYAHLTIIASHAADST